jgi:hypothetical protein
VFVAVPITATVLPLGGKLLPSFATYAVAPSGLIAMVCGMKQVGLPVQVPEGMVVMAPVDRSTAATDEKLFWT